MQNNGKQDTASNTASQNFMVDLVTQLVLNPSQIILEPVWKRMSQKLLAYFMSTLTGKGQAKHKNELTMAVFTNKAKTNLANDTKAAHSPDMVIHFYCPHPMWIAVASVLVRACWR